MSFAKFVSVAAIAAVAAAQNTTYVVTETSIETITSCAETVTDCPALNHNGTAYVTHTNTLTVTSCPEESVPVPAPSPETSAAVDTAPVAPANVTSAAVDTAPIAPAATTSAAIDTAPVAPTPATTAAPVPSDDTTTFVTVEQGVTVTVVGTKSSSEVAEVPEESAPVQANGAAALGYAGALVAGALLL